MPEPKTPLQEVLQDFLLDLEARGGPTVIAEIAQVLFGWFWRHPDAFMRGVSGFKVAMPWEEVSWGSWRRFDLTQMLQRDRPGKCLAVADRVRQDEGERWQVGYPAFGQESHTTSKSYKTPDGGKEEADRGLAEAGWALASERPGPLPCFAWPPPKLDPAPTPTRRTLREAPDYTPQALPSGLEWFSEPVSYRLENGQLRDVAGATLTTSAARAVAEALRAYGEEP